MKKTIIIDTEDKRIDVLRDGCNIIDFSIYDESVIANVVEALGDLEPEESISDFSLFN